MGEGGGDPYHGGGGVATRDTEPYISKDMKVIWGVIGRGP